MPVVTEISQQKRDASRYNISIDGEYAFAVSANALLESGLHQGQQLSESELVAIKEKAHGNRAYDQSLNYLSLRKRSRAEIKQYLDKKREYDEFTINAVLDRLERARLISDSEFATAWIADRNALKPRSRRMLAQELRAKGLSSADIEVALAGISDDEEVKQIKRIAIKKAARYGDRQKLIAHLGSLGFSYDLIKRALQED